ncbi:MAG TPA: 50S ribosomal protein L18 [Candidatus Azoamicus sp. MARI]
MLHTTNNSDKRKKKIREKIKLQDKHRLTVYKSNKHIYAQLYKYDGSKVLDSMSSVNKLFKQNIELNNLTNLTKIEQSKIVGNLLAIKMKQKNINSIVFDRSGFKFHGRIKAVADAIKENGINI